MSDTKFELKLDHLKLLQSMYVGWSNCEYGAPEIDPKRPYGNSDVERDIFEILAGSQDAKSLTLDGVTYTLGDDDDFPEELSDALRSLHLETQTALQLVLQFGVFTPGHYKRKNAWSPWKKV